MEALPIDATISKMARIASILLNIFTYYCGIGEIPPYHGLPLAFTSCGSSRLWRMAACWRGERIFDIYDGGLMWAGRAGLEGGDYTS